jgi:hypothetical protein
MPPVPLGTGRPSAGPQVLPGHLGSRQAKIDWPHAGPAQTPTSRKTGRWHGSGAPTATRQAPLGVEQLDWPCSSSVDQSGQGPRSGELAERFKKLADRPG